MVYMEIKMRVYIDLKEHISGARNLAEIEFNKFKLA